MKFRFTHTVWSSADGRRISKGGARDLAKALKLQTMGLAKVRQVGSSMSYGKTYDNATDYYEYEVTI